MKKQFNLEDKRTALMGFLALEGVKPEEYETFLKEYDIKEIRAVLQGEEDDEYFDYEPLTDADNKTLRLKIQLCNVSKPPMWREVLVPADFNFTQLHYVIQAAVGLDNCHLWQFQKRPYDHCLTIGIPITDQFSFGIEDCTNHADMTPLTAFLAEKGDKLVYVYDFRLDWIFSVTVMEVLDRQGEVAECRKFKSELQALDDFPPYMYQPLREYMENPKGMSKADLSRLMREFGDGGSEMLQAYGDEKLIDLEFVNEQLAEIPDEWQPID